VPSVYLENQEITKELKRQKHELELKIKSLNKIRYHFIISECPEFQDLKIKNTF